MSAADEASLRRAIDASLDGLLAALTLESLGEDRFRAPNEPDRFGRIFGGQLIGQTMMAAGATVVDQLPHSIHANFVSTGDSTKPVELLVDRVRDGRSMSTRRVTIAQAGRTLLVATVSFHAEPAASDVQDPSEPGGDPEAIPRLQDWAARTPPHLRSAARSWIDTPPPLDMRIGEPTYFLGGTHESGPRSHWMRTPRPIGADPLLHRAVLVYASDYFLLDMAFRGHPTRLPISGIFGISLDHSVWLHAPVHVDDWHAHTQELVTVSGQRGLVRGLIHDRRGRLVASTTQEVLVRAQA